MPVSTSDGDAADSELRALLEQLKTGSGLTYESLAEQAVMSRGAAQNYITKPGHRRDTKMLEQLLEALGASAQVRDRALELHRRTLPTGVDPAEVGWAARARAAECTVWTMAGFTATEAAVHTAIGRRHTNHHGDGHADRDLLVPPRYVPRAHDVALRHDIAASAAGDLRAFIVLRGRHRRGRPGRCSRPCRNSARAGP